MSPQRLLKDVKLKDKLSLVLSAGALVLEHLECFSEVVTSF